MRSQNGADQFVFVPRTRTARMPQEPYQAFVAMDSHEGEAPYVGVNSPIDFGEPETRRGRVPKLGEHTAAVLDGLGD